MPTIRKIFPADNSRSDLTRTLNIVFIAEGYTENHELQFTKDCLSCVKRLKDIFPFNRLKQQVGAINFFSCFVPSDNEGPVVNSSAIANRTFLESTLDTSTNIISINNQLFLDLCNDLEYFDPTLDDFVAVNDYDNDAPIISIMPFILIPANESSYPNGGELLLLSENSPEEVGILACTADNHFENILAQFIGYTVGLGAEYDMPGNDFLAPTDDERKGVILSHLNLITESEIEEIESSRWSKFLTKSSIDSGIDIHSHPNSSNPNRELLTPFLTTTNIQLWEGGAGFRTGVFRSAEDCIMRRKVGDVELPIKQDRLGFCPICRNIIQNRIGL